MQIGMRQVPSETIEWFRTACNGGKLFLDMTFDEDRSRIRTGHGPANATLLRRFAIGLIRQYSENVAETTRSLARKPRRVLDMLKPTGNTRPRTAFS